MRLLVNALHVGYHKDSEIYMKVMYSLYGVWNLDFFRLLYKPFCINYHLPVAGVLLLDYLVAFYPLVLILVTYAFIILHERGCKLVVTLWRPFHKCFARFRSQWSIKKSLVHAFSTFILYQDFQCII